jgi:hypothetical protein
MSWKKSDVLMDTIRHYSGFPATGVSLRQMVQFGEKPSTGMCDSDFKITKSRDVMAKCERHRYSVPRFPILV